MLLGFHNAFAAGRIKGSALDYLLPRISTLLQERFCNWVDGGAGIGHTSKSYGQVLKECLEEDKHHLASITCYEPLNENFEVLENLCSDTSLFTLRKRALSDRNGIEKFSVPNRLAEDEGLWVKGSSYSGFVGQIYDGYETVDVETVRLEEDLPNSPDFLKLDLQGGEVRAIEGLGSKINDVKLAYVEAQLLEESLTTQCLHDSGFLVMYDKFQLGLTSDSFLVPVEELMEMGICIDGIHVPQENGIPLVIWGYMSGRNNAFDGYCFSAATRDRLKGLGVNYFQTDIVAINMKHAGSIIPILDRVI